MEEKETFFWKATFTIKNEVNAIKMRIKTFILLQPQGDHVFKYIHLI